MVRVSFILFYINHLKFMYFQEGTFKYQMLVTLLLKPPRLMEINRKKGSIGIQSVELGREGIRKWKLFLYIPFCTLIFGKEYSFILLHHLCIRVVKQEGNGRRTKEQRGEVQI